MTEINGQQLATAINNKAAALIASCVDTPILVSFCNSADPASVMYSKMKQNAAASLGIEFQIIEYSHENPDSIKLKIEQAAKDPKVAGIMLQLPLSQDLVAYDMELRQRIPPEKDVDGLRVDSQFFGATVDAVWSVLDFLVTQGEDLKSKNILVLGSLGEVGSGLMRKFKAVGLSAIGADIKIYSENEIDDLTKSADILISATGHEELLKPENVKAGGLAFINVGLGAVSNELIEKFRFFTPTRGGIGPLTVAMLMLHTAEAWQKS